MPPEPIHSPNGPVRVLQMVGHLGYAGLETMIVNLYRNLDRSRFQFDFVVTDQARGRFDDEIEAAGGVIHRLPNRSRHPLAYHAALKRLFDRHHYPIFHCNTNSAGAFLDLLAARRAGVPARICHSHASNCLLRGQHFLFKGLLDAVVTHRLACSEPAARWMFGNRAGDCTLLRNGIQIERFRFQPEVRERIREGLGLSGRMIFGHVGNFQSIKNQTFVVDVFAAILRRNPAACLLLIGEGPEAGRVREKVERLGLAAAVRFLGNVGNVHEYMQAMDGMIFPSLFEGFGLVLVEAQAAGLPVLSSDTVPQEVALTDFIQFASLGEPAEAWAARILAQAAESRDRAGGSLQVSQAGFDIREQVRWLEDFYGTMAAVSPMVIGTTP
jgi:glycosyltransferase involved in cell wall biosynthesis